MLFYTLLERIDSMVPRLAPVLLASGHVYVPPLTAENQTVESLPQTLANSLNLIQDAAPLKDAIAQLDMHIEPCEADVAPLLDIAPDCSIVLCKLSETYTIIQYGMPVLYVDKAGATYKCWSQANERNSNQ